MRPVRARAALALLLCGAGCLACARAEGPSVVVIMLDTARADYLAPYGAPAEGSPRIAELARRGATFGEALAASSWTKPSVAAVLTGRYPDELGILDEAQALPGSAVTLAEMLGDAGYATGAVVSNGFASARYGNDQGFDHFHYESYIDRSVGRRRGLLNPPSFRANRVTDSALAWLESARRPFFLYAHYSDPHAPYSPPEGWRAGLPPLGEDVRAAPDQRALRERLRGRTEALVAYYAAEIRFADHEIGRLLDALPDDTVVVLTGDHGEEFDEHGGFHHRRTLFDELLRIPLVLVGPGVPADASVAEPVSHVDVLPTILELVGVPAPADLSGRSLVPLLRGRVSWEPRAIFAMKGSDVSPDLAVRRGDWKLIRVRKGARLYDLARDPGETQNLAAKQKEVRDELRHIAGKRLRSVRRLSPMGAGAVPLEEHRELLRDLGYVE